MILIDYWIVLCIFSIFSWMNSTHTECKKWRHPLVVQHTGGRPSVELLLLQDAFKVLHPLLQVPHVSRQVTVEKAHRVAKHCHPRADAPFISLRVRKKEQGEDMHTVYKIKTIYVNQPYLCSGTKSGCFSWVTEPQSQAACCCTDLKEKETAPAAAARGWCWHQHAREGHTLTYAPTQACMAGGTHTHHLSTSHIPLLKTPQLSWHKPTTHFCTVINPRAEVRALQCAARTQYPPSPVRVLSVCTPLRNGRWQNLEKTRSSTPCIRWDAT